MMKLHAALTEESIDCYHYCFEGKAMSSKVRSVVKWLSKCISMAIAKTASRNVACKVTRMRESIMDGQDELIIHNSECYETGLEEDKQAASDNVEYNADLLLFRVVLQALIANCLVSDESIYVYTLAKPVSSDSVCE